MSFPRSGGVSERFKEHAWKACVGETQPWVQIPPSPPFFLFWFHLVSQLPFFVYQWCIVRFSEIGFVPHQGHRIARPRAAHIGLGLLLPLTYPRRVMLLCDFDA